MALKKELKWTAPDSGITFELEPIPPFNLDDFSNTYDKRQPKPKPPLIEITVVDKKLAQANPKDEYYLMEYRQWEAEKENASTNFMFYKGVKDNPPDDWEPDELLYEGTLAKWERKAMWVKCQLATVNDIRSLMEAINSINNVTEAGIENAKNGMPPALAEPTSSNGKSNTEPIVSDLIIP